MTLNRAFKVIQGHPYWCRQCPIQLKMCMSHGLLADSVDTSLASLL